MAFSQAEEQTAGKILREFFNRYTFSAVLSGLLAGCTLPLIGYLFAFLAPLIGPVFALCAVSLAFIAGTALITTGVIFSVDALADACHASSFAVEPPDAVKPQEDISPPFRKFIPLPLKIENSEEDNPAVSQTAPSQSQMIKTLPDTVSPNYFSPCP